MPQHATYALTWCQDDQAYKVYADQEHKALDIVPESAAWETWLHSISSFAFRGQTGSYTARKEHRGRGEGYWYAYVRLKGKVTKRYLGPSTGLRLARLEQVAQALTTAQHPGGPHEEAELGPRPSTSSSGGGLPETAAVRQTSPPTAQLPPASLVLTKVQAPRLRSALVHRSRLLERLEQGIEAPLTLISAPAGFGKTTLLTSWLAKSGTPAAWFSVEPEDNDPVRFFTYLLAAFQRLAPGLGTSVLPLLQSSVPPPLETVLALLINELSTHEEADLVLVLDDYHVVTSESIHRAITYLVEHLPPQLHLLIASRADPGLPLARLRARGQLSELRAADLRFGQEEADQFLRSVMGVDLSLQESALLQRRTEGWIAGLQFAALALQGRSDSAAFLTTFSGSHRFVLDYLSQEVLARQPPAIQSFLLCTSILERLSGALCEAVTGQEDSQARLEALERANLFVISLDEERHWYRYHHLFAEVLRNRLKQSYPDLIPVLHRRASIWYEQQALLVEAVQHALAANDVEHAADMIERDGLVMAAGGGQFQLVLSWLNALPQPLVRARPHLCLLQANLLLFSHEWEKALTYLAEIEKRLQDHSSSREAQIIQGKVAVLRGSIALSRGDLASCVTLAHEALTLLPESEETWRLSASVRTGLSFLVDGDVTVDVQEMVERLVASVRISSNLFAILGSILTLGRLYMMQGKLHQALTTLEQTMQGIPEQVGLVKWFSGPPYIGKLLREWNELDAAERFLKDGLERLLWADIITEGYITLARIQWARSEYQEARVTLEIFEQLARQHQFVPHVLALGAATHAEIALAQGDVAAAIRWADSCGLSVHDDLSYLREREYLTLARVRIAQGRANPSGPFLDDALTLLERLLADAQPKARMHSVLELLVLKALTLQGRGDLPTALDTLAWALNLAAPEGYLRLFLDEGPPMLTLLSQVGATDPSLQDYVQRLLAHAHLAPGTHSASSLDTQRSKEQPLVEPLSERELEVLHLMAAGASNEEIADQLVIAIGTAKRHVSNILAKLAVSNRTQAGARAREVGLL